MICVKLFDFLRSDLSFVPVIEFSVTERSRSERHSYENDYGRIASAPLSNRHCQSQNQAEDSSVLRTEIHQIQSNPSKKTFCLICVDLFDFSRSDSSFVPVIERQPKYGIPMKTIMVALLRLRSATDIASHRTKPKIQVSCEQKFIKYNQILPKNLLFDLYWFV